ncbi:filamentous hemagglutinin N-terminal domain-containing protein, partial [bacterium]|nr:filamentous hemagglutinin N-terminal domain-containing protein [bacterium]
MNQKHTIVAALLALGLTTRLWALPQDPTPVHGQVQIQNGANLVQILQQTPQAIINWGQFSIGQGESVRFLQPGPQAAILNRVTGLDPSVIQGALQANGQVFLLNPNGILFGPGAVVDVGSFTASTLKMSDEDFLNGTFKLTQDHSLPLAALTNQGTIKVAEGGFVVLVSPLLDNQGMILAQAGQVQLGASTQATFSVDGRGLVQFALPDGFDPQFQGGGSGGTVLLQPGQMSQLLSQVVTNPALVEAGSFQTLSNGQVLAHGAEGVLLNSGTIGTDSGTGQGGSIRLDSSQATILPGSARLSANSASGDGGDIRVLSAGQTVQSGSISATAETNGRGGFVEVSGKHLWLVGSVNVSSAQGPGGSILLDPTDITIIDGAGGSFDGNLPNPNNAGSGSVSVSAMQGFSAVTLNASHDVIYNGAGFSLPGTSLSILAGNDILFTTSGSIQASSMNLQASRDVMIAGTGSLGLSTSADLVIVGGRNVAITANGSLGFSSPTQTSLSATNGRLDLSGSSITINGPRNNWTAAGNLSLSTISVAPSVGAGNLTVNAGNLSVTTPGANGFALRAGNFTVNASQDFVANTTAGNFDVRTSVNGLNITAGQSIAINPTSGYTNFQADNGGGVSLTSPSLSLRGTEVFVSAPGDINLRATGGDALLRSNSNRVSLT